MIITTNMKKKVRKKDFFQTFFLILKPTKSLAVVAIVMPCFFILCFFFHSYSETYSYLNKGGTMYL